ncbi:hypothetical protein HDU92_004887, partial [Lobulomyces angularis]
LENLPNSLRVIDCIRNSRIKKIENLPFGLTTFSYVRYFVREIDNISMNEINFSLLGYQSLKRVQKRLKMRYSAIRRAAKVIHAGCFNWIWKPICNDGSIGIRPRLDLNYFGIEEI